MDINKLGLMCLLQRMIGKFDEDILIAEYEYEMILNSYDFWYETKIRNLNVVRYEVNK